MIKKLLFAGGFLAAVGLFGAAVAYADAPMLSQYAVTVGLGQTMTVTSQTPVYLLSNPAPTVASVSANGTQIAITGNSIGSSLVSVCAVGTASSCSNLTVNVQSGVVSLPTFSPQNLSLTVGNSQNVAISNGSGPYTVSANSSSGVATASLASSTLTVSAVAPGNTAITVCGQNSACSTLNVAVSASASNAGSNSGANQYVNFSTASATVAAGQSLNITLSPGYMAGSNVTSYVVFNNQNPGVAGATISNTNLLNVKGVSAGSDLITVCAAGTGCNSMTVTVTGTAAPAQTAAAAPQTQTQTATGAQSTPTATPVSTVTGTATNASLVAAIQSLQGVMAQLVGQIQSLQTQLTQVLAQANVGDATSHAGTAVGAAASGKYVFTELLTVGSQDAEVTVLQQDLAKLGYYSGAVTGYYGPATEAAVKAYQSANGLTPVGYVGPGTRAALNAGNYMQ
ncbi:MAG: peptidoglycan-binding protein [Patescibacteria group bacterium]|nr:peptidoglycan-binding protein [Patescibacteria group bacterium]